MFSGLGVFGAVNKKGAEASEHQAPEQYFAVTEYDLPLVSPAQSILIPLRAFNTQGSVKPSPSTLHESMAVSVELSDVK